MAAVPLFQPVQPLPLPLGVVYREHNSNPALRAYVCLYWELASEVSLPVDFHYQVVADGCVDLFWNVADPSDAAMTGVLPGAVMFPIGRRFHYRGIRFTPAGLAVLGGVAAGEVAQQSFPLADVLPALATELADAVVAADWPARTNDLLLARLNQAHQVDPRFVQAWQQIVATQGQVRLETELDAALSPRHLRRLFQQYVGLAPKAYARIIRFQACLRSWRQGQPFDYLGVGYYDQAHFIQEFRALAGQTPTGR